MKVPKPKFDQLAKLYSALEISEGKSIKGIAVVKGKNYVITGGCSDPNEMKSVIWGHEIVPINQYSGSLKPLEYSNHNIEVRMGKRDRGYGGMIVRHAGMKYVCLRNSVEFHPVLSEIQLTINI